MIKNDIKTAKTIFLKSVFVNQVILIEARGWTKKIEVALYYKSLSNIGRSKNILMEIEAATSNRAFTVI